MYMYIYICICVLLDRQRALARELKVPVAKQARNAKRNLSEAQSSSQAPTRTRPKRQPLCFWGGVKGAMS